MRVIPSVVIREKSPSKRPRIRSSSFTLHRLSQTHRANFLTPCHRGTKVDVKYYHFPPFPVFHFHCLPLPSRNPGSPGTYIVYCCFLISSCSYHCPLISPAGLSLPCQHILRCSHTVGFRGNVQKSSTVSHLKSLSSTFKECPALTGIKARQDHILFSRHGLFFY